ncbi:hypothetical protein NQ315_005727 [Exocentrus adspersus]|uniref:Uncharacterized protein n=2 Tax=Exocentrus adspersus TaxID=1586481 RepID=A0AAV8VIB6_9CUCU|nr:hypothetical protein NQ315_005727 [Exocentrus adspersus]
MQSKEKAWAEIEKDFNSTSQLQRVIYIFFYLFGKQNGACNLLHGEVILKGLNRKQTEFIAVPNIYYVVLVMDIQQYITESKVRRRT